MRSTLARAVALMLGGAVYLGRSAPGRTWLDVGLWAPRLAGIGLGLLILAFFSLGVGGVVGQEWPAAWRPWSPQS